MSIYWLKQISGGIYKEKEGFMTKQKYMYGSIVALIIGVFSWLLSLFGIAGNTWIISIPIGILAIVLAVKMNGSSYAYKTTKKVLVGLGILMTISCYFIFTLIYMVEDLSEGYVDKNIVVIAPTKGTIPIKAGGKNELDKNDNKERTVYFSKTNCPSCKKFSGVLEKAIRETKADVYYYNTEEMIESEATKYEKRFGISKVPVLMKIKNGKVTSVLKDGSSIQRMKKFLK